MPEAGLRFERGSCRHIAKEAEQPPHFDHRLAAGCFYYQKLLSGPLRMYVERLARGTRLQRHEADAVADNVVELPRHPRPLIADSFLDFGVACLFERCSAISETVAQIAPMLDQLAEAPGHPVEEVAADLGAYADGKDRREASYQLSDDDDGCSDPSPAPARVARCRVHDEHERSEGLKEVEVRVAKRPVRE